MIEVVAATRRAEAEFWSSSPLGHSLRRLQPRSGPFCHAISFANVAPLPDCYNERIRSSTADSLLFVHDDVWIDDFFVVSRVEEALQRFDVIGVAGNRRRLPRQPAWAFIDGTFRWDSDQNLSGSVAHGSQPFGCVGFAFESPADCELLDGVFLAARTTKLREAGVFFDPQFAFHFYDLDFCRTARRQKLKLGTWPIAITHVSGGSFSSPQWRQACDLYFRKWLD